MKSLQKQIIKYQTSQTYVQVEINGPYNGEQYVCTRGCIVDQFDDFLILARNDDFTPVGYAIIPIDRINDIKHTKSDLFYEYIIKQEGQLSDMYTHYTDHLKTMLTTLEDDVLHKIMITIDTDDTSKRNFHIGYVVSVGKKSIIFQYFNSEGQPKKPYKITKKSIISVEIQSPYTQTFQKYITTPPTND